jgi:hypothetical protein
VPRNAKARASLPSFCYSPRGAASARAVVTAIDEAAFAAALPLLKRVLGIDDDAAA